jgi:hypothetical protein
MVRSGVLHKRQQCVTIKQKCSIKTDYTNDDAMMSKYFALYMSNAESDGVYDMAFFVAKATSASSIQKGKAARNPTSFDARNKRKSHPEQSPITTRVV